MSWVREIIVLCSMSEDDTDSPTSPISQLNERIRATWGHEHGLKILNQYTGGNKAMQSIVAMGAFSTFNVDEFLGFAAAIDWIERESVQILVKEEQDRVYAVHRLALKAHEHSVLSALVWALYQSSVIDDTGEIDTGGLSAYETAEVILRECGWIKDEVRGGNMFSLGWERPVFQWKLFRQQTGADGTPLQA